MSSNPALLSLYTVSCVFLLDSDGRRLLAKYYTHNRHSATDPKSTYITNVSAQSLHLKSLKDQRAFEQAAWDKTKKSTNDIILYNNQLILYKPSIDLTFYVCGDESQNELMLQGVLTAFYDAVSLLLRHQVEKRSILENLDLVVLALDETIDEGIILETDATAIAARVSRPRADAGSVDLSQITINEQTIMHAFSTVRDRMAARILQECMDGFFIASHPTNQIILSTRFSPRLAALVSLALDALKSSKLPVLWFPCPSPPSHDDTVDYDEADDDDDEVDERAHQAADTNVWAQSSSKARNIHGACVCCVRRKDLVFALLVSSEVEPTLPFAFVNSLIGLLEEYFGSISETTVKDSFDVILQIFEQVFSAPQPMITDASALRELIPPPSLYSKVLNAATSALSPAANSSTTLANSEGRHVMSSPIPWRRNGIKYQTQEVYFDVVEEIGGIIDKNGKIIIAEVCGRIEANSKLSGMPDLLMTLSSSDLLQDCCFHPCIRLNKWSTSKVLSFVPPDGKFTLMEYQLAPPSLPSVIPLQLKPTISMGKSGGAFHIVLSSRSVSSRPLENVKISFELGRHASQVQATLSGGRSNNPSIVKEDSDHPGGRYDFQAGSGLLTWQINKMSSADRPITFSGTWTSSLSPCPRPALAIQASFEASVTNISGIQITSLKVVSNTTESAKPYKGVRPMLKSGKLEYRWM